MSEGYRWNSSSPLLYNSDEWCRRLIANSPSQTGMKTRQVTRIALFIPSFVLESSTQHPPQDLRASVKLRCYKFKSYSSAVGNLKPVHLSIANLKNKDLTPLLRGKGHFAHCASLWPSRSSRPPFGICWEFSASIWLSSTATFAIIGYHSTKFQYRYGRRWRFFRAKYHPAVE